MKRCEPHWKPLSGLVCENTYHMHNHNHITWLLAHKATSKLKPKQNQNLNQTKPTKPPSNEQKQQKKKLCWSSHVPPWKARWHRKPIVTGLGRRHQQRSPCVVSELAEHPPSQFYHHIFNSIVFCRKVFWPGPWTNDPIAIRNTSFSQLM